MISTSTNPSPTAWTRPQQLLVAGYGVWAAVLTVFLALFLETPARTAPVLRAQGWSPEEIQHRQDGRPFGLGLVAAMAVLYLVVAWFSYRGRTWSFWPALALCTITGFGAIWVPSRPEAHAGLDTSTLVVHAFVTDLPGLLIAAWLLVGLLRYRHAWARATGPRLT